MTDPRYTLRQWFDPSSADCKVDGTSMAVRDGSNARFEASYEMSENNLRKLFLETTNLDVVFVIKKVRVEPIVRGRSPIGYRHFLGIQPAVVDKWASDGSVSVLATELLGKALDETRRVIRENIDAGSTITVSNEQPEINRIGSTLLYGDVVIVKYDQYD